MVIAPLSEVPMSATRHLNALAAEDQEPVAAADLTMGTPKQAWAPQTPLTTLDAVATMVSLLHHYSYPKFALAVAFLVAV